MRDEHYFLSDTYLPDLGLGAGIAMWGFRACARGGAKCCTVVKGFEHTFGKDAPSALKNMMAFAEEIGHRGRRKVGLAMPGCARVTSDELSIVAALSAAQARDAALRDAHLSWLMAGPPAEHMSEAMTALADCFSTYGLQISAPKIEITKPDLQPHKLTLVTTGRA